MRTLLILMIFFSVIMGISTNIGTFTLYETEFSGAISSLTAGKLSVVETIEWIMLLVAHVGIISLPFFTKKEYFRSLLVTLPLLFILIYFLFANLIVVLLIPFIIIWSVCLFVAFFNSDSHKAQSNTIIERRIDMKLLLIWIALLSLFVGIPINAGWFKIHDRGFPAIATMINDRTFSDKQLILCGILVIANFTIILLPFLTKKKYFKPLLIGMPLLFITIYIISSAAMLFFVVPIIILWFICLIKLKDQKLQTR
jgi:hypothetical protein